MPRTDAEGCLQDGHWAAAMFGYFPVYTVGNLVAAQVFARARGDLPDLDAAVGRGDFHQLLDWLRENIYRHGSRYPAERLIERSDRGAVIGEAVSGRAAGEVWGMYG